VRQEGEGGGADLVVAADIVVPKGDLHVLPESVVRDVQEQLLVVEVGRGAAVVDRLAALLNLSQLDQRVPGGGWES
jgi:hypothetical protein